MNIHILSLLLLIATGCCSQHSEYCRELPPIATCRCDLDHFGHKASCNYGVRFLLVEKIKDTYCVLFTSEKKLELDQGRKLALPIVHDFLHMLSDCPVELVRHAKCKNSYIKDQLPVHKISLKITFWNEDVNRPKPPHLAEIRFSQGTFYYYESDPMTQELRLVAQESYEEAVKNSKYQRLKF